MIWPAAVASCPEVWHNLHEMNPAKVVTHNKRVDNRHLYVRKIGVPAPFLVRLLQLHVSCYTIQYPPVSQTRMPGQSWAHYIET